MSSPHRTVFLVDGLPVTHVMVGKYDGIRGTMADRQWETARAVVAAITLVVNIITF